MNNKRYGLKAETALRDILMARGYLCIRSAASKVLDLVCVPPRGHYVYGIEVKRTSGDALYCSRTKMQKEQHAELIRQEANYEGLVNVYAVMFGDGRVEVFDSGLDILREHEGVLFGTFFPDVTHDLLIPPNTPPIVPQEK